MDCIFCSITNGQLESTILYQDDVVFVINDIHPKAKVHMLVIPKQHIVTFNDFSEANANIMSNVAIAVKEVTEQAGIAESGYKVISNNGAHGGQVVQHLHFHVLGGESIKGIT